MTARREAQISSRKLPKQARSTDLVAAILDAARQVLAKEGARRFTTARVAEKAGVSVGSVYQYFPNKAAILFRLQSDEWRETIGVLRGIVEDTERLSHERLRALTHAFIRSECAEAAVRMALDDAAPDYHEAPEAREVKEGGSRYLQAFLEEALPATSAAKRLAIEKLMRTTLSVVGKHFSEKPRAPAEIDGFADSLADMLCAYLEREQRVLESR